ncbi:histone-lysine N-methyltransferase SETMAR [Trichonephila clavipes]|nr:histone-lysine N-methyltransferase SETMAR [Trichonephila clavipes]
MTAFDGNVEAIKVVLTHLKARPSLSDRLVIFSDYQASILTIANIYQIPDSLPVIQCGSLLQKLHEIHKMVVLQWIVTFPVMKRQMSWPKRDVKLLAHQMARTHYKVKKDIMMYPNCKTHRPAVFLSPTTLFLASGFLTPLLLSTLVRSGLVSSPVARSRVPDLIPSDFHLFLHLKSFLAGKHFNNDKELKENVSNWLKTQAATFYEEGIEKLVPRYDTCLQNFGSYVER